MLSPLEILRKRMEKGLKNARKRAEADRGLLDQHTECAHTECRRMLEMFLDEIDKVSKKNKKST